MNDCNSEPPSNMSIHFVKKTIEMLRHIVSARGQQCTVEQLVHVFERNRRGGRLDPQVRIHQLIDEQLFGRIFEQILNVSSFFLEDDVISPLSVVYFFNGCPYLTLHFSVLPCVHHKVAHAVHNNCRNYIKEVRWVTKCPWW